LKHDACGLSFVEPKCPVVGPAYQVVGVDVLNDSEWTTHNQYFAKTLPKNVGRDINKNVKNSNFVWYVIICTLLCFDIEEMLISFNSGGLA
jgi:hypothetical protein